MKLVINFLISIGMDVIKMKSVTINLNNEVQATLSKKGIKILMYKYSIKDRNDIPSLNGNVWTVPLHEFIYIFGEYIQFGKVGDFMKSTNLEVKITDETYDEIIDLKYFK